ncbi:MAG: alpha amylase C-terminal domain-containing protein [Anaplasmataceae bacterium]|nr:alpha amylase C-terminal domain-containing protein [Anaplasmataceae bacterium]MBS3903127.1 alpha amylase C-terminal domain-containing protein [Anaplasmataceae bacterium]
MATALKDTSGYLSSEDNSRANLATLSTLQNTRMRLLQNIEEISKRLAGDSPPTNPGFFETRMISMRSEISLLDTKIQGLQKVIASLDSKLELPSPKSKSHEETLLLGLRKTRSEITLLQKAIKNLQALSETETRKGRAILDNLISEIPSLASQLTDIEGDPKSTLPSLKSSELTLQQNYDTFKKALSPYFVNKSQNFTQKVESDEFNYKTLNALYESLEPEVKELVHYTPNLFYGRGLNTRLYDERGAQLQPNGSVRFSVFAPNAKDMTLCLTSIGDDELEEPLRFPMESDPITGVWTTIVGSFEDATFKGSRYHYELTTQTGNTRKKIDPMATGYIRRPDDQEILFDSVVCDYKSFKWTDQHWMDTRQLNTKRPVNIYEVHPSKWNPERVKNWRHLAPLLAEHCKKFGYTDIELFAVLEHPGNTSFSGYQVSGFFAPNSRLGTIEDFQYFINYMHAQKIAVILDWIPAHFCIDSWGLEQFGSPVYERRYVEHDQERVFDTRLEKLSNSAKKDSTQNPLRKSLHPSWGTYEFDFSKAPVREFLTSSAIFWLRELHLDGLRLDAVASMIHLGYDRERTDLLVLPSDHGDKINHDALHFMRNLNAYIRREIPRACIYAEESSGHAKVIDPVEEGGVGFLTSWNMGWMNDTFEWAKTSRFKWLAKGFQLRRNEHTVYEISHDEVRGGDKPTLIQRMGGSFSKARNIMAYQMCMPGPKLTMMGSEYAQDLPWSKSDGDRVSKKTGFEAGVFWDEIGDDHRKSFSKMLQDLGQLYQREDALWFNDGKPDSLLQENIDHDNEIISYHRKGSNDQRQLLCIHNFKSSPYKHYRIQLPNQAPYTQIENVRVLFNSDDSRWGGKDLDTAVRVDKTKPHEPFIYITLPPMTTMILEESFTN